MAFQRGRPKAKDYPRSQRPYMAPTALNWSQEIEDLRKAAKELPKELLKEALADLDMEKENKAETITMFKFRHKVTGAEISIPAVNIDVAKYYLFVGVHRDWIPEDVEVIAHKLISTVR